MSHLKHAGIPPGAADNDPSHPHPPQTKSKLNQTKPNQTETSLFLILEFNCIKKNKSLGMYSGTEATGLWVSGQEHEVRMMERETQQ